MHTTITLYSLNYRESKTYLFASLFVVGNLLLPQICHLFPLGGSIWLPIYFFTLIGAYKYGWRVGILTALFSPLVNNTLFGMPNMEMLPIILIKSTLLAFIASYTAAKFQKISLPLIAGVVVSYQILGGLAEWLVVNSFHTAIQDFRLGLPGMALQILGGWTIIRWIK